MLNSAHGVGEGTPAVSEADLQSGEVIENPAHQEGDDGGGGLGRHPHQPGQPVLGEPAAHLHVPRVDKQHRAGLLAGLHGERKICTVSGKDLSFWQHVEHFWENSFFFPCGPTFNIYFSNFFRQKYKLLIKCWLLW